MGFQEGVCVDLTGLRVLGAGSSICVVVLTGVVVVVVVVTGCRKDYYS